MDLEKLPVYKLWFMKPTIEVSKMPKELLEENMRKHNEFFQQSGGKLLIQANMAWSNEEYSYFGIEEFPSLAALVEFQNCLGEMDWTSYLISKTYLGFSIDWDGNPVPMVSPPPLEPGVVPIYKIFLWRPTALYFDDNKGAEALNAQIEDIGAKAGMVRLMVAYARWNNEEWFAFGLERYPSLNAFAEKYGAMDKLGWYRYMQAKAYLGYGMEGSFVK